MTARCCEVCGISEDGAVVGCWDGRAHGFPDLADVPMCGDCMVAFRCIDLAKPGFTFDVYERKQYRIALGMAGLIRALRGNLVTARARPEGGF